jgi:hypothetical protein
MKVGDIYCTISEPLVMTAIIDYEFKNADPDAHVIIPNGTAKVMHNSGTLLKVMVSVIGFEIADFIKAVRQAEIHSHLKQHTGWMFNPFAASHLTIVDGTPAGVQFIDFEDEYTKIFDPK